MARNESAEIDTSVPNPARIYDYLLGGKDNFLADRRARGLMRERRDLVILDEPSAGLDAEAEHAIHRRLMAHRMGATSLLISHRLNAVRQANLIVVLAGGRIIERGTHDELLRAGGEYARLFTLQAEGYGPANRPWAPMRRDGAYLAGPDIRRTTTPSTRSAGT